MADSYPAGESLSPFAQTAAEQDVERVFFVDTYGGC